MRLLTGGLRMFRLGALDVRMELRCLAPIEAPIVAHDANLAVPEASMPAVEICSERSAAGMITSARLTL